jgi:DNA-binding MarR family transcriptional regulator
MKLDTIQRFRQDLRKFIQQVEGYLKTDTCCYGVSIAQCHTLLAVESLGRVSLNQLADHLGLDKSTLSRTVESLVKTKLLLREINREDRRAAQISLSTDGLEVCKAINLKNNERFDKILSSLGNDPDEVVKIFSSLVAAMENAEIFNGCNFVSGKKKSSD